MFDKLFSPIKIKDLELRNRVILPAMGTKFSGKGSTDRLSCGEGKGRMRTEYRGGLQCPYAQCAEAFLIYQ